MITKRKHLSAKNITPELVDAYVESLGGYTASKEFKNKRNSLFKKLGFVLPDDSIKSRLVMVSKK